MLSRILKTKSFWAGVALIVAGVGGIVTGSMDQKTAMESIIAGLLAIFVRDAIAKV